MGRMLIETVSRDPELTLAVALDHSGNPTVGQDATAFLGKPGGVLITDDLNALADADCLIDFTRPEGTLAHLAMCRQLGVAAVIGTTGFSDAQKAENTAGPPPNEATSGYSPSAKLGAAAATSPSRLRTMA